jgi:predicted transcriptional regulator with HTH domain
MVFLTTAEVARQIGIDPSTVRDYLPGIDGVSRTAQGHWLIPETAVDEIKGQIRSHWAGKRRSPPVNEPVRRALVLLADWKQGTADEIAAATRVVPANARKALAMAQGQGLATRIEGTTSWTLTKVGRKWLAAQEVAA